MWSKQETKEAIERLREMIKPGDKVYTTVNHVSRSGMYRAISVHLIKDNEPIWISRLVAKAVGFGWDDNHEAIKVNGCGMDMGFHVVYELSRVLFPNGFGIPTDSVYPIIPKTKEEAAQFVKNGVKFHGRNGDTCGWDNDGGYALKQEWL